MPARTVRGPALVRFRTDKIAHIPVQCDYAERASRLVRVDS
jgi:hypothetical protein